MATLREQVSGPDVPPAVRLRTFLAVLEADDAMKPATIGSTSARGVKASMEHRALIESLGGCTGIEGSPVRSAGSRSGIGLATGLIRSMADDRRICSARRWTLGGGGFRENGAGLD